MLEALLVVIGAAVIVNGLQRAIGLVRRRRAAGRIGVGERLRVASGVSMRVLVQGTRALRGMSTRSANRTRGDLILGQRRFLLVTNRGIVADVPLEGGHKLLSARCTGPGRLVLEGDVPNADGRPGLFRVDVPIADAEAWADALQPYVRLRKLR